MAHGYYEQRTVPSYPNIEQRMIPSYPNIKFYEGKMYAYPNDLTIDEILQLWPGNFDMLEGNHNYIQWLFPNRDAGLNPHAFTIHPDEPKIFNQSSHLKYKLKMAFNMMLQFFGMQLTKDNKFELTENGEERLLILNTKHNHNFSRITRILKCLLEFGHDKLMLPWLKFLAKLIYVDKTLNEAEVSFNKFWIPVLDAEDGIILRKYRDGLLESQSNQETKHNSPFSSNAAIGIQEGNSASSTHKDAGSTDRMPISSSSKNDKNTSKHEEKTSSTHKDAGSTDRMPTSSSSKNDKNTSKHEEKRHQASSTIIKFYKNEIPLPKTGLFINDILSKPDKIMLKNNTIYMHWLFPNEISGTLQDVFFSAADAEEIRETPALKERVLKAFKMMLELYGMELTRDEIFCLRYPENLYPLMLKNTPDQLKITRILRSLKELGHKDLMLPWLRFLATLIYERKNIKNSMFSMEQHWMETLDKKEKKELSDYINAIKK